ncbi:MAG: fibronectin type III domain-containing protein [Gammaproteobacteria bacterium]
MSSTAASASPKLNSDTKLSTAGYFQLSWQDSSSQSFTLQQASNAEFRDAATLYRGPDQATVISGLPNGNYFYRVRSSDGQWSKTMEVSVKHHSLVKALGFFGLGAVMFITMVALLLNGARRKEE